jgi:tyrosyl-tRNA synthetase
VNSAHCIAGNVDNGLLAFLKYVVMVIKQDKKKSFVVKRDKKYGGDLKFRDYTSIEEAFKNKILHPLDLKRAISEEINNLLKPIRNNNKILDGLSKKAYD